jgi:type I restriction enzyme S subunit
METELCAIAPEEWRVLSLEDVCGRITSGGTPSRRHPDYYFGGTWPWVKTQELQDKWIDHTEEAITERAVAESSAKVLPSNRSLRISRLKFGYNPVIPAGYQADFCKTPPVVTA